MAVSKEVFDFLLDHMLDIHKRKMNIISPYVRCYDKYMKMLNFLNAYIRRIGDFLDTAVVTDENRPFPFVILGSRVMMQSDVFFQNTVYSINLPEEECAANVSCYDCLSPMAEALLFKGIGDKVALKDNGLIKHVTIKDIVYP